MICMMCVDNSVMRTPMWDCQLCTCSRGLDTSLSMVQSRTGDIPILANVVGNDNFGDPLLAVSWA